MVNEGSRRMDLNLYLGLPRRPAESSDLGSDLALGSLPLSEEMSSSNTQSYPPVSQPTQPQGEVEAGDGSRSRLDVDHSPYSPSRSPVSPTSDPNREAQSLDLEAEDGDDQLRYVPTFVPIEEPGAPAGTEGLVLEGSSSNNHDEYVPYTMPLTRQLHEVLEENTHIPYVPMSATAAEVNNENGNAGSGPAVTSFRSYHEVDDGALRHEYLQLPEFRFRRLIEATHRRVRRYRSRVPYEVNTDWNSFTTEAVRAARDTRVSEALAEAYSAPEKTVEDVDQDEEKEKSNPTENFDCNVCLDVAKEPVVTSCGHLFCWPCLFQWLHIHCDHRECPVCKGEVTDSDITPIYGRGSSEKETKQEDKEADSSLKIPPRPHGRRLDSMRQRISRPLSRRPREDIGPWSTFFEEELNNRVDELEVPPPTLGTLEATDRRMLARLMAVQRFRREEGSLENLLNFGANGSSSSVNEVPNNDAVLDRLQGLGSLGTHPVLARRGIDFWRRFAFNSILSTDRLTAIASDLTSAVGMMETGGSNSGASASTSTNPRVSRPRTVQRPPQATPAADQASASSTIAVIQGEPNIPHDAPAEPSSVGSSRTLRRRRRNTVSGSLDIDGVNHAVKRRRLN